MACETDKLPVIINHRLLLEAVHLKSKRFVKDFLFTVKTFRT